MNEKIIKTLRIRCSKCGHWSRIPVNKIFMEHPSPETMVKVLIPMYQPLGASKCEKCGTIVAEPKELIRTEKRS